MNRAYILLPLLLLSGCGLFKQEPSKVVYYGTQEGAGTTGMHTVVEEETVYTIAQNYNLPMKDIILINKLSPPYLLTTGYRLKLPPPNEYRVRPGDTIYAISQIFNVPQSEIASLNNIQSPYRLQAGQIIRLPSPQPPVPKVRPVSVASSQGVAAPPPAVEREALGAPPQPKPAKTQKASAPQRAKIPDSVPKRTGQFMRPVNGKVISTYGPKADGLHNDGINIKAARGTPVRAAENGVVVYAGNELKGYGNLIIIRHEDRFMTAYAHMDKMLAARGDKIKIGQSIGTVGSTGQVGSPQLHFEIRRGTKALNPEPYL